MLALGGFLAEPAASLQRDARFCTAKAANAVQRPRSDALDYASSRSRSRLLFRGLESRPVWGPDLYAALQRFAASQLSRQTCGKSSFRFRGNLFGPFCLRPPRSFQTTCFSIRTPDDLDPSFWGPLPKPRVHRVSFLAQWSGFLLPLLENRRGKKEEAARYAEDKTLFESSRRAARSVARKVLQCFVERRFQRACPEVQFLCTNRGNNLHVLFFTNRQTSLTQNSPFQFLNKTSNTTSIRLGSNKQFTPQHVQREIF